MTTKILEQRRLDEIRRQLAFQEFDRMAFLPEKAVSRMRYFSSGIEAEY
jgi:hypothetical protein